uniref:SFRICE_007684 n=1 Tax=Spodoptera frugiperda TaxID=7108 RepID=A0A2H1V249_SPOFR
MHETPSPIMLTILICFTRNVRNIKRINCRNSLRLKFRSVDNSLTNDLVAVDTSLIFMSSIPRHSTRRDCRAATESSNNYFIT